MPIRPKPLVLVAALVAAVLFAAPLLAEGPGKGRKGTPDGQTPAEETVCDPLKSATRGLYGLCVAYCEAQDCDFADYLSGQCDAPSPKILQNYRKRMRPGDPDMPCLAPQGECPCFVHPDGRDVIADAVEVVARFDEAHSILLCSRGDRVWELAASPHLWEPELSEDVGLLLFEGETASCDYLRRDREASAAAVVSRDSLTGQEAEACRQAIEEAIELSGVVCPSESFPW